MSYVLTRDDGERFRFGHCSWAPLLQVARLHGWQPQGGESELRLSPDEHYIVNIGQHVTAVDATELAAALERALDDIPEPKAVEPPGLMLELQAFIEFCRGGGFTIH